MTEGRISEIGLAMAGCRWCGGTGRVSMGLAWRLGSRCDCTYRRVFRDCNERYRRFRQSGEWQPVKRLTRNGWSMGMPPVEFMVDFELTAWRALRGRPAEEWAVFRHHHLGRVAWPECGCLVGLNRGDFYHAVYRVEMRVGRACMEARPYSVWPREYFAAA